MASKERGGSRFTWKFVSFEMDHLWWLSDAVRYSPALTMDYPVTLLCVCRAATFKVTITSMAQTLISN